VNKKNNIKFPLITVLICTYNKFDYLKGSIDSVLQQEYPCLELIVADDASKDFPKTQIEEYINNNKNENISNFTVYSNSKNLGTVKNLNNGAKRALGKYIIFMAGDDEFYDSAVLERVVCEAERRNCGLLITMRLVSDESLRPLYFLPHSKSVKRILRFNNNLQQYEAFVSSMDYNMASGSVFCLRRNIFENMGRYDEKYHLWEDGPFLEKYLDGFSASGMFEARLGRELTDKVISTFSPAYQLESIKEISFKSNMVVFNSMNQFSKYNTFAKKNHCSCGIRINPQYSELPLNQATNPCADYSRLGITMEQMPPLSMFGHNQIEGLHLHTMCAQYDDTFERTLTNLIDKYSSYLNKILWLNMGGGQLYSAKNYDIERTIKNINYLRSIYNINVILEPSEGILTEAGYYVSTVIDIVQNGMKIAILDCSAVCHIPDMVYGTWRHNVINAEDITEKENKKQYPNVYRLAGCYCYSGDIFGDY